MFLFHVYFNIASKIIIAHQTESNFMFEERFFAAASFVAVGKLIIRVNGKGNLVPLIKLKHSIIIVC